MPSNEYDPSKGYTPLEISSYAARNEMPTDRMTYIDWLLWYMLRDIYNEFAAGTLTKEEGAQRKEHALDIYYKECEYMCRTLALCDRVSDLWKKMELVASAYRKERTLENADELMRVVYGFV